MWHRKPEKYKEFEGMQNIIVGKGELTRVITPYGEGWKTLDGNVIYNRAEAEKYAAKMDAIISYANEMRLKRIKELNK